MARPAVEAGGEDAAEGVRLGDRAGLPVGRQRLGGDIESVFDVRRDGEGYVSKDRGGGAEHDGSREAPRVRISSCRGEKASVLTEKFFKAVYGSVNRKPWFKVNSKLNHVINRG